MTYKSFILNYSTEFLDKYSHDLKSKKIDVRGNSYLQSSMYWDDHEEYVMNRLKFKPELVEQVREKYKESLSRKTIGISIRRGDIVGHKLFYQIPISFFMDSVKKYFPDWEEYNLIFFSDDMNYVKENFTGANIFYADNSFIGADWYNDPMEQMIYGSLVDNFVISSSTFSWWLAYYAVNMKNNNGKVIHCGQYTTRDEDNAEDYYHKNWITNKLY